MILGYIAEHSLPLSLATLVKLVQEASRDPMSFNRLALSKQTIAEAKRIKEKAIERANKEHKRTSLKRKCLSSAEPSQPQKKRHH